MDRDSGNIDFPIWIVGDSPPARWKNYLKEPFDSRHPIRHNIITSVFDVMQDTIYRKTGKRLETSKIYTRNAVGDVRSKPSRNQPDWSKVYIDDPKCKTVNEEIKEFKKLYNYHSPKLILTFGAFAYEFARRALGNGCSKTGEKKYNHWDTKRLGKEFSENILNTSQDKTVILPLLHRSIAGGYFLQSHKNYCGQGKDSNYFNYVGKEMGEFILKHLDDRKDIWVEVEK